MEILWQFFILLSEHRLCASGLRTPTWMDGFIWYFTAWWPVSLGWNLSAWILKNMKCGDFMAVFLTFQLNIDFVHLNAGLLLHGWMDLYDKDALKTYISEMTSSIHLIFCSIMRCIPGFTADRFIWQHLTTLYINETCLMENSFVHNYLSFIT